MSIVGLFLVQPGLAAVEDSQFDVSSDGMSVQFELREVSRREVLDRLFANRGITLTWHNRAAADESVSGSFHGPLSVVAWQLLAPLDFVLGRGLRSLCQLHL
jgi:hypothetical protein